MAAGAEAKKMVPEFEKQYTEVCNLGSAHLKQGWQSLQEYHADNYFIARSIGFGYLFDNIGNFTIHVIYHGVVLTFIRGGRTSSCALCNLMMQFSVKSSDSVHCSPYCVLFVQFLRVVCCTKTKTCNLVCCCNQQSAVSLA